MFTSDKSASLTLKRFSYALIIPTHAPHSALMPLLGLLDFGNLMYREHPFLLYSQ